jgi:bifunctional DNA-binding transcriptional regulator/antitoxin component of YhaV-PrlF toxin-antitoxin module
MKSAVVAPVNHEQVTIPATLRHKYDIKPWNIQIDKQNTTKPRQQGIRKLETNADAGFC